MNNRTPPNVEQEIAELARSIERKGNGPEPVEPALVATPQRGVADDLAQFVEQHAEDMMREAQTHLEEAREFAQQVRERTAAQIEALKSYTDSIKASREGMAQVRAAFISAATGPQNKEPQ